MKQMPFIISIRLIDVNNSMNLAASTGLEGRDALEILEKLEGPA
jgi:hypothetical protein